MAEGIGVALGRGVKVELGSGVEVGKLVAVGIGCGVLELQAVNVIIKQRAMITFNDCPIN